VGARGGDEQVLKEHFQKFWMEAVIDGFRDDLEQIRKARVDSLVHHIRCAFPYFLGCSGAKSDRFAPRADVFSGGKIEVVLESAPRP
jgi:hypothetical protein